MISQVLVPLQMRLPSPMPLFYVNIHALSYTVIFDIDNEVRHFINHHRMAIMIPGSCWLDRNTIQQWGPGYVCCTLSQSSLMSDWFTNRSQIWMIIIRYRRTCPALLIWQIWPEWQTGHRQGRAPGQAVLSSWMIVNSTDVYDCMSSTAARQLVSYCLMISLNLCGMSSS